MADTELFMRFYGIKPFPKEPHKRLTYNKLSSTNSFNEAHGEDLC